MVSQAAALLGPTCGQRARCHHHSERWKGREVGVDFADDPEKNPKRCDDLDNTGRIRLNLAQICLEGHPAPRIKLLKAILKFNGYHQ